MTPQSPRRPILHRSVRMATCIAAAALASLVAFAGPLDPPPGPISPTYKTLSEVEPRTPITAATTPGDADSLFRIAQPGSYYLTGNITGMAAKHGIDIAASGVTLDLMGFELTGVNGSLDGVSAAAAGLTRVAVRNGSVRAWGGDGINLASPLVTGCIVTEIRAAGNAGNGIRAGRASVITGCTAAQNGLSGILGISGCVADGNGAASTDLSEGIFAGDGSTVTDCTSQNNTSALFGGVGDRGMGFRTSNRCIVRDCTASRNRGHGFRLLAMSSISGCSASENGSGSTVSAGIYLAGSDNQVDGNHTAGSDFGVQAIAPGNIFTRNVATGNGANYNLVADNLYGPIIDRRIPTTIPSTPAVNGFAAASTLGSTDPRSNFSY